MPQPATRDTFHHGSLRSALLAAARDELARKGPAGFSLRAIVRDVGVSPNAAYHHFRDRADVLRQLARAGFGALADRMEAAMAAAGSDPWARFEATGRAYLAFAEDEPALFDVMFTHWPRQGERSGAVGATTGLAPDALLSRALDDCVDAGVVGAQARNGAEDLAWPAIHGLAVLARAGAVPDREEAFAGLCRGLWKALTGGQQTQVATR